MVGTHSAYYHFLTLIQDIYEAHSVQIIDLFITPTYGQYLRTARATQYHVHVQWYLCKSGLCWYPKHT